MAFATVPTGDWVTAVVEYDDACSGSQRVGCQPRSHYVFMSWSSCHGEALRAVRHPSPDFNTLYRGEKVWNGEVESVSQGLIIRGLLAIRPPDGVRS